MVEDYTSGVATAIKDLFRIYIINNVTPAEQPVLGSPVVAPKLCCESLSPNIQKHFDMCE